MYLCLLLALTVLVVLGVAAPVQAEEAPIRDLKTDAWVATDALGRTLPGHEECGPPRERAVGVFYFLTHGESEPTERGPLNVTKIREKNPKTPDFTSGSFYWGEPEYGYYSSTDPWVIRRHLMLLADAGVDTLIYDVTNNVTFPEHYMAIAEVMRTMRAQGEATPKFCFLGSERSILKLWDELYAKGLYSELWYEWKGKPLLLFGQFNVNGEMRDVVLPDHIHETFTIRESWAWDSLPWYLDGKDQWPWVAHYPQCIGWHESPDKPEQVPATIGQHPISNIGRSFHDGKQPPNDPFYNLTAYTGQGLCFEEQWRRVHEVDPEFVFVTGWNEWVAGAQQMKEEMEAALKFWDFFPGADLGLVGRELKPGDWYFIDQYNQEYSRDAEPMKGGHTDNYYYQLWANIRKYKGIRAPEAASAPKTIDLAGGFDQWDDVGPAYLAHAFDDDHRDHPGSRGAPHYTNTTGRNDLVVFKVARDAEMIYFLAETREPLTPHTDAHWMLLFINADHNPLTGWEGYDFLVNGAVIDETTTTVLRCLDGKNWTHPIEVSYRYEANQLMIAVPRSYLGQDLGKVSFDFHWADGIQKLGDITEFFLNGDSAPPRRAMYRYEAAD